MLTNQKHEKFCRLYATSNDAAGSYKRAYKNDSDYRTNASNASRLLKNDNVLNRIDEIRQECAKDEMPGVHLNMAERRAFLALLVRTPIRQINADSILCQSWKVITGEFTSSEEFKIPDKLRAIELDAKLAGELSDTVNVNLRQPLTPEQILAAVQRSPALAALGKS